MNGGAGNDIYVVGATGDVTTETGTSLTEIDTVQSSVTRTLGANLERLTLTGAAAINGNGNALANLITGNGAANTLSGGSGNDTLFGAGGADTIVTGAGSDTVILSSKVGTDRLTDYVSASDTVRISQATLAIGDGDTTVDGGVQKAGSGGFSAAAEVVVITTNIAGALTAASAATAIGSAISAYATGATRLFVVDNGTDTGVFLFTSSGANALVSASELTQLALIDAANTVLGDYLFTT
jgi:Ca2+-binding RTX toxin-like protein